MTQPCDGHVRDHEEAERIAGSHTTFYNRMRPGDRQHFVLCVENPCLCERKERIQTIESALKKARAEGEVASHVECIERQEDLLAALRGVLADPGGCSLCDLGKPRNEAKGHQPDCPYETARAAMGMNK